MVEFNGSNAYQMRYEEGAAEKKKQQPEAPEKKRIQPNMTLKLNRRKKSKPVLPHKPVVKKGRSLDAGEVRLRFAGGFAFCVLIAFFSFILRCNASNNELRNTLNEKKQILANLQSDYSGLVVKRDQIFVDEAIEEYATKNLGMQRKDGHQTKWFEVSWDDEFDD